jgi:hypothetical protein
MLKTIDFIGNSELHGLKKRQKNQIIEGFYGKVSLTCGLNVYSPTN